jgi:hypothetical protein
MKNIIAGSNTPSADQGNNNIWIIVGSTVGVALLISLCVIYLKTKHLVSLAQPGHPLNCPERMSQNTVLSHDHHQKDCILRLLSFLLHSQASVIPLCVLLLLKMYDEPYSQYIFKPMLCTDLEFHFVLWQQSKPPASEPPTPELSIPEMLYMVPAVNRLHILNV